MTKFLPAPALMGIAEDMIRKGWQPVWCPARQSGSFSPLPGCTGGASYPTVLPQPTGPHKLAFRPPPDVLVLDVDDYDEKHGDDTLVRAVRWLGELPETFRVTSRGYLNPSGRYLYRIPADLVVTDSSLFQFADPSTGRTDVEIVRTGHRFSWAPGDYHYKNDQLIQCWDEEGTLFDEMPDVDELPALPEKWVAYFRNPPVPQKREVYTRPSDGAEWWLSQADQSLGTDAELSSFAYNMLLSRVPEDEIFAQWVRVSVDLDPARPWERSDFDRHIGSRTQNKVAEILAHQDYERAWFEGTGADLDLIEQRTKEGYESNQRLAAERERKIVEATQYQQNFNVTPLEEDDEDNNAFDIAALIRGTPEYDKQYRYLLAKMQAEKDVAKVLARDFVGYEDFAELEPAPSPSMLQVIGKDSVTSSVVAPRTVTVLSGKRASGKTWVAASWAAQILREGGHVLWIDFERQNRLLREKFTALHVYSHILKQQFHYTGGMPPIGRIVADIQEWTAGGKRVLMVVDAFRGLQALIAPGTSANDGDAVEAVYLEVLNEVVAAGKGTGATVAVIDHVSKAGLNGTFGSERKESAADYVINVEQQKVFSRTSAGFSVLTVTKDRYGHIPADTPAGYLWMPSGDGKDSGDSIDKYPPIPELRNWSPLEASEAKALELTAKGQREIAITDVVLNNPLSYGPRELGRHVFSVYPDLFPSAKAATDFAGRMAKEGKLTKEEGKDGKYEVPPHVFTMPGRDIFGNERAGVNLEPEEVAATLHRLNGGE